MRIILVCFVVCVITTLFIESILATNNKSRFDVYKRLAMSSYKRGYIQGEYNQLRSKKHKQSDSIWILDSIDFYNLLNTRLK